MMELFWTSEAIQDRNEIYDYIEADNPTAALALDELFAEKAGRLVDHPALGRLGRVAGTRELVAHQNYILSSTRAVIWSGPAHQNANEFNAITCPLSRLRARGAKRVTSD
ncbi:MAG: type II toxin-antitoxin system RelE/ParE family toxin [Burkholderiaceae bacterium]|nr:type II toxin-antitoxin system RelE/ParE family toxin [Burkholderiaceae bacterium]